MPAAQDVNRHAATFCVTLRHPATLPEVDMIYRRDFLAQAGGAAAGLLAMPALRGLADAPAPALPPRDLYSATKRPTGRRSASSS